MRMKTISLLLFAVILAGCAPAKPEKQLLTIRGSNTFGEELAPALIAAYTKEHPGLTFDTEFKGTSYGTGNSLAAHCHIAATSRPATTHEIALAQPRGIELSDHVIRSYASARAINSGHSVTDPTPAQMR